MAAKLDRRATAAYGNERQVGEAVHDSGLDRSEVFLETKIWISDYGYHQTLHGILTQAWSSIGGITFYRDGSHGSTLADPVIGGVATAHGKTPARLRPVRGGDDRDRRPGQRPESRHRTARQSSPAALPPAHVVAVERVVLDLADLDAAESRLVQHRRG